MPTRQINTASGTLVASQASSPPYMVDANITVLNYTATTFTWMSPVTLNLSLWSNDINNTVVFITYSSDALESNTTLKSIHFALNIVSIIVNLNPLTMPGDHAVTIMVSHNSNSTSFTYKLWVGSNLIIAGIMFFGVLGIALGIFAKYSKPAKKPSSGSSTITSAGSSSATSDDDTSTATYVDQSRAPAGRIFCPECKKVIEEGSIFCPECGTRIPRYLRYHP